MWFQNIDFQNYEFNWESVKILDNEFSYIKRSVSEMIHIKKQILVLNTSIK